MKTKMKMKNNRMFLALVMVAALAMVSVAGVAVIADDSSAAETQYVSGDGTISAVNGNDYFIDVNSVQKVIISDKAYSGTISVGVFEMNTDTNGNVTYKVIGTISSVTLEGAKNAVVLIGNKTIPDIKGTLAVISAEPTNATVKAGTAVFASNDEKIAFSGTVKASGATITIANVDGLAVTAGSTANIFSQLSTTDVSPVKDDKSTTWGTVTISGAANINNNLTVGDNVKLVIAEGADVTVGKIPAMYNVGVPLDDFSAFATASGFDLNSDYKMVTLDGVVLTQIQIDDLINNSDGTNYTMNLPVGTHTLTVYYNEDMTGAGAYTLTVKITVADTTGKSVVVISDSVKTPAKTVGDITSTVLDKQPVLKILGDGEMVVVGTLKTAYATDGIFGSIVNNGTIDITGMISCQNKTITGTGTTNAASYSVAPASDSTAPTMNNYTTLANAMTKSDNITIIGTITIDSDTTLTGNSGATPAVNKITVEGTLNIGTTDKTAVVTVPKTVALSGAGTLAIVNGQVKIEGMTEDSLVMGNNSAAVFMVSGSYGIYTDLATALGMAVKDNTVTLRADAEISSDAEIKSGVILDAKEMEIDITAGGKLTVNGKLINGTAITVYGADETNGKAAGELILNVSSGVTARNIDFDTLNTNGVVTIGTDVDITMGDESLFDVNIIGIGAVFNVNGIFSFEGTFDGDVGADKVTFNVSGKLIVDVYTDGTFVDEVTLNVTVSTAVVTVIDVMVIFPATLNVALEPAVSAISSNSPLKTNAPLMLNTASVPTVTFTVIVSSASDPIVRIPLLIKSVNSTLAVVASELTLITSSPAALPLTESDPHMVISAPLISFPLTVSFPPKQTSMFFVLASSVTPDLISASEDITASPRRVTVLPLTDMPRAVARSV